MTQRLGVTRRVELDPAAAQLMEPRRAAHERAPLVRRELVFAEEVAQLEVEQRAEPDLGRPGGTDLDTNLRARPLLVPPLRHVDTQPAVRELGRRAQQGVRLRGGPRDRVIDLAALDEIADGEAHAGGPAQRREQALPGCGVVGVLAQRGRQRHVQHAPVRPLAARDGDEEREGVRRVVLALGDMQVHTVAVRVDAVGAQEGLTRHAGAGELAARRHPDLAPRDAEGALGEPGTERVRCEREQPGEQVRRRRERHGLSQVRRGQLTKRGAGDLAAKGQLRGQPLIARRRESQQPLADLRLAHPCPPAKDRVLALAVLEDEQLALACEHESRGCRGSREDVHAGVRGHIAQPVPARPGSAAGRGFRDMNTAARSWPRRRRRRSA